MEKSKNLKFKNQTFKTRLSSMLSLDFRRMLTMPLFYIMVGISFVMPILILVMTTLMDGTVSVDPQTGVEITIEGFKNVWQIISAPSGDGMAMSMDLTSMCNINLLYFLIAIVVCLFVADDFRSGYAKNLFTVRPKKNDYVVSKTLVCFCVGVCMILFFFVGSMIGGAIAGLPFTLKGATVIEVIMCLLSKIFLMAVFVSLYLVMTTFSKQKSWLSILCSLGSSMLLFTMIPMMTPLNSSIINVIMCLGGGALFAFGLGTLSNYILKKTSLV